MNNLKTFTFLFLYAALGCSAQADKVRLSDLKSLANKWCGSNDIRNLGFDACRYFCDLKRSTCEERIMKTRDLMVKCSPEKKEQFNQMLQQSYGECQAQVRPLEEMRFAQSSLCPQWQTLPKKWQDYCTLLHSTCEETILKTNDLMMRCGEKEKAAWNKLQFEKFQEALSASPSTMPPLPKEENKPTSRDLFEEECLHGQPSKQCNGFCFLSRSTCEESILKTRDLMMRCNDKQKVEWNKMLEQEYNTCLGAEETADVKEKETPQAILERKIKDLVSQKKLTLKETLSLKDLAVLVALAKELEKEGISVGSGEQAGRHKEEL